MFSIVYRGGAGEVEGRDWMWQNRKRVELVSVMGWDTVGGSRKGHTEGGAMGS